MLKIQFHEHDSLKKMKTNFSIEDSFNFTAKIKYVNVQLIILKTKKDSNVSKLRNMFKRNHYFFEYNEQFEKNLKSNCEFHVFQQKISMIVEFLIHSTNLRSTKSNKYVDYNFRLLFIILINYVKNVNDEFSIISKKRRRFVNE